jgi:glycoside hydrolase-like protein
MAPAVKAYGLDYSARELSSREIDEYNRANPHQPISFLIRYIGYPANKKCISHYPGALRAHEDSGRAVLLVHQVAYQDFAGGRAAGVAHAHIAVGDAERAGWKWDRPIFAALDRYLNAHDPARGIYPIALGTVREYVAGFRSVLGELAGLYGFWDVMQPCVAEDWVRWRWQCGAEQALVQGAQFYQSNRGFVYPGGLQSDLNKSYVDSNAFGGDDDMALDAERDYPALLSMMQRAIAFELRPGGAAATWENGPTIYESLAAITSTVAAIANDVDITPEELNRVVNEAVERHTAKAEDVAKALAPEVAREVVALLPRNEDGTLAIDVNEELIAAEVINLAGRKLGAA